MNLFVGLVEGGDAMMVGVWPPGQQAASLRTTAAGNRKGIDGLSFRTGGRSFYLALLEKPRLWHAEPLQPDYVEKETAIGWKRPFEAKWIGRFFIASEEIDYPFYFRYERAKLWGRSIRGWFTWPVWFDGERTVVHFEKPYPPRGEMLIYFLERHPQAPGRTRTALARRSDGKGPGQGGNGAAVGFRRRRGAAPAEARQRRLRHDQRDSEVARRRPGGSTQGRDRSLLRRRGRFHPHDSRAHRGVQRFRDRDEGVPPSPGQGQSGAGGHGGRPRGNAH